LIKLALAVRHGALVAAVMDSTLGMMIANVPAVLIRDALSQRINMKMMRWVAAELFIMLGILSLFALFFIE